MIHFILLTATALVLVLLLFQWKTMNRQQSYIKLETESLRLILEENLKFIPPGLFGLLPESRYLIISEPRLVNPQKGLQLSAPPRRERRKNKNFQPF